RTSPPWPRPVTGPLLSTRDGRCPGATSAARRSRVPSRHGSSESERPDPGHERTATPRTGVVDGLCLNSSWMEANEMAESRDRSRWPSTTSQEELSRVKAGSQMPSPEHLIHPFAEVALSNSTREYPYAAHPVAR